MDLNSINANINRLLTNIWAVISFLKEFAVDGAKDVSITYINADGSESVKTFSNIAKMKQEFIVSQKLNNPDLDSLVDSGTYSISSLAVFPLNRNTGTLFVSASDICITQLWQSDIEMLTRRYISGAWTAWVEYITEETSFGKNQIWQDVKSNRDISTIYTNTSGKPIMVAITKDGNGNPVVKVDGVVIANMLEDEASYGRISFVVPNGSTYQITDDATTITTWAELR